MKFEELFFLQLMLLCRLIPYQFLHLHLEQYYLMLPLLHLLQYIHLQDL